jgi:hypothetical protein
VKTIDRLILGKSVKWTELLRHKGLIDVVIDILWLCNLHSAGIGIVGIIMGRFGALEGVLEEEPKNDTKDSMISLTRSMYGIRVLVLAHDRASPPRSGQRSNNLVSKFGA